MTLRHAFTPSYAGDLAGGGVRAEKMISFAALYDKRRAFEERVPQHHCEELEDIGGIAAGDVTGWILSHPSSNDHAGARA